MVAARPVHLCGVPIRLFRSSQAQVEGMLQHAEQALAEGGGGLTTSLALTVRSLSEEYADVSGGIEPVVEAAESAGDETVDLLFEVPVTMASAVETWLRLLEHLDDLAAAGEFEHPPTAPEIQEYRRWLVAEVAEQLRQGRPPVAYADRV